MCVPTVCFLLCDAEASDLELGYANRICMHKYLPVPVTASVTWNRETGKEKAPPAKKMATRMEKKAFITCWVLSHTLHLQCPKSPETALHVRAYYSPRFHLQLETLSMPKPVL